jgi:ketopantoate reductase
VPETLDSPEPSTHGPDRHFAALQRIRPLSDELLTRPVPLHFIDCLPAQTRASMAVDLAAGRRLELPWLSGTVVRKGTELGIPTPANTFVCQALNLDVKGIQD